MREIDAALSGPAEDWLFQNVADAGHPETADDERFEQWLASLSTSAFERILSDLLDDRGDGVFDYTALRRIALRSAAARHRRPLPDPGRTPAEPRPNPGRTPAACRRLRSAPIHRPGASSRRARDESWSSREDGGVDRSSTMSQRSVDRMQREYSGS
jgi:hypothetical protein